MFLDVGEVNSRHSRWDDGMVVGHLRRVEHSLGFLKRFARQWCHECLISPQSFERGGTFGIDVITQELCIHTRICGEFLLI